MTVPRLSACLICSIVLTNCKDRTEVIKSISIVFKKSFRLKIIDFDEPLILNPMSSARVETKEVSAFYLGSQEIDLGDYLLQDDFLFEIEIPGKVIKFKWPKERKAKQPKKDYTLISTVTKRYNDVVFSDNVWFAILYNRNGAHKTAFIEQCGYISGDWDFKFNALPPSVMTNPEKIRNCLITSDIEKYIGNFVLVDLRDRFPKTVKS